MATLRTLDPALADDAQQFVDWLRGLGVRVTVTSARRSSAKQAALYARYKAGKSKYPAAAPGTSKHEQGFAFDLGLNPPVYAQAGQVWEQYMGGVWGGRFNDEVHYERGGAKASKVAAGFVGGSRGPQEAALEHKDPIGTVVQTVVAPWWSFVVTDPVMKWLDQVGL